MSQRLTVAQILPQMNSGGVERGTLEVNRALIRTGHRSIVISGGGRLIPQLEQEGGEHIAMQVWKKNPLSLLTVRKMRHWIRETRPDILHARSRIPAWVTWLAWRGLPENDRPAFLTTNHGLSRPNAYSKIMTRGERVIAVSNTCRDHLLKSFPDLDPDKITVVHRGVDPQAFPHSHTPSDEWLRQWYEQYPQLRDQFVALLPGRITRFKGHLDFIAALERLQHRGLPVMGVIAGPEDPKRKRYLAELRERINYAGLESSVIFTGHRSDLQDVMSVSDVVISSSVTPPESFGRTVLESLRLGRITLGYAHGGVGEVLGTIYPEGRIPKGDVEGLANGIERAMDGQLSPPPPGDEFSLELMLTKVLQVYEEMAGVSRQSARRAA